jgi:potassium-transporting ATPase ATP-binding subunit
MTRKQLFALFDRRAARPGALEALRKLDPRVQWRNPVMFVVYRRQRSSRRCSGCRRLGGHGEASAGFILAITLWLWFTVLFANFAEALAEGRSRRRRPRCAACARDVWPRSCSDPRYGARERRRVKPRNCARAIPCWSRRRHDPGRRRGHRGRGLGRRERDHRRVGARDPRIGRRFLGGHRRHARAVGLDRRARHVNPGETFIDRMISMVEGARQKTPNEIALTILLVALTLVFLVVIVTLLPFSQFSVEAKAGGSPSPSRRWWRCWCA